MLYDVAVIGCGVVGAATAYQLARYQLKAVVLEAQNDVANGTTKANSAIVHAGYDPEPGTLMADLNVQGNRMTGEICKKLDVPFSRVGSFVLAFDEADMQTIETLYHRGVANGVPDQQLLTGDEARAMEPTLSSEVKGALYAPSAGIISPWEFALAMAEAAVVNGVELVRSAPVTAICKEAEGYCLTTPQGEYHAKYVINAAGVYADQVHALLEDPGWSIHPVRGEYYLMDKNQSFQASRVIFQCPNKDGKGVLVSPTIHGNLIVGPNAETIDDKANLGTSGSGQDFVRKMAVKSIPGLSFRENIRNFAGLRAVSSRDDFILEESATAPGFIDLAGIKSPGLSSAPAIGLYALRLLEKAGLTLDAKAEFVDERHHTRFKELDAQAKNELIQRDPRFGRVICRCETITEGEIVEALHSPIPALTVNGVKRRCNAGMGRCQGGFCGPRVQAIIARELGMDEQDVLMDQAGTYILTGQTKQSKGGKQDV